MQSCLAGCPFTQHSSAPKSATHCIPSVGCTCRAKQPCLPSVSTPLSLHPASCAPAELLIPCTCTQASCVASPCLSMWPCSLLTQNFSHFSEYILLVLISDSLCTVSSPSLSTVTHCSIRASATQSSHTEGTKVSRGN